MSPQKGSVRVPKVQYTCVEIGCNKVSTWNYPSTFKQSRENYRCRKCAAKITQNRPEVKHHKSECGKIRFENPESRNRMSELMSKIMSAPAVKKLASEKAIKRWEDPEERKRGSISQIKRFEDPNSRKSNSESQIKRWKNTEERIKHSEKAIKRWEDPEERVAQSDRMKKVWSDTEGRKNTDIPPETIQKQSDSRKKYLKDPTNYERLLINAGGQGFWYGHPILHTENKKKKYCELWNKDLWVRIDAAWDYKSAISEVTRWETYNQQHLDRHHVYWQEKACCEWDEDAQGYFAMINNGTKAKPDMIKYYIKGDPNKFVLLTHDEHGIVKGSKKSGKDKIYWVKYFEDLIEKREAEGKKCYLSKEEYDAYKVENADKIAFYTQTPAKYNESVCYNPSKITNNGELQPTEQTISDGNKASDQGVQVTV